MTLSKETLKHMIQDMGGPELGDAELEQVLAEVQVHQAQSEQLRQIDLSKLLPARLFRVDKSRRES